MRLRFQSRNFRLVLTDTGSCPIHIVTQDCVAGKTGCRRGEATQQLAVKPQVLRLVENKKTAEYRPTTLQQGRVSTLLQICIFPPSLPLPVSELQTTLLSAYG
jgi:hypothetical protein